MNNKRICVKNGVDNLEEYNELLHLVKKGTTQAHKITHAQVLLKLDESFNEKPWNVEDISDAYHISTHAICDIAARFVDGGLAHALERKKQMNRHHKITGDIQAPIIAVACSDAPRGGTVGPCSSLPTIWWNWGL